MKSENGFEKFDDGSVVVGRNPVMELLGSERNVEKIYVLRGNREGSVKKIVAIAKTRHIPVVDAAKEKLDEMAGGGAHQGVAAITSAFEYVEISDMMALAKEKGEKPLIVVLDGVEDPHNVGAVIRSAECAGAHGIIIGRHRSASMGQTVFKASAGAAEHIPIAKAPNIAFAIDELKSLGVWIFAADMNGESVYETDFDCPAAIVLGSEGNGISRLVKEKCDFTVSIPMKGKINSLNVSAAAAIILFEAAHRRS